LSTWQMEFMSTVSEKNLGRLVIFSCTHCHSTPYQNSIAKEDNFLSKRGNEGQMWWHTSAIPVTWESEIRSIRGQL
jgi:hypothetical protein